MVNISELQISLIAVGIVVVMGVIFFNWLQQRRYRRQAEEAFGQKHEDVLLRADMPTDMPTEEGERIEPRLGSVQSQEFQPDLATELDEPDKPTEGVQAGEPIEPIQERIPDPTPSSTPDSTLGPTPELAQASFSESIARPNPQPVSQPQPVSAPGSGESPPSTVKVQVPLRSARAGNRVDYVVAIHGETVIADSSLAAMLQRKFDFSKPVRWLGQRAPDVAWEEITSQSQGRGGYVNLKACLQLVDRAGPVSEVNLSEFRDMAQNFSMSLNAVADCPDLHEAYAQALALDEFCAEVDVMIGINIISRDGGALTGAKIRVLAESSGFRLGADGMFSYRNDNNAVLFYLSNFEPAPFLPDTIRTLTTHGITFLLDVPKVAKGEMVFDQMVRLAGNFADTLGGIMVDDNRVPLNDNGIQKIKQQLIAIESRMSSRHIPAGGEIALRLFA
jgi:FtsZ-interacting cell division protein ZipA